MRVGTACVGCASSGKLANIEFDEPAGKHALRTERACRPCLSSLYRRSGLAWLPPLDKHKAAVLRSLKRAVRQNDSFEGAEVAPCLTYHFLGYNSRSPWREELLDFATRIS